jgi:hypothetical protein
MRKVAPELDCLMWTLVEQGNDRAVEEFLTRYPEMKPEIGRRAKMVNGLKKMKTDAELQLAPPPFRPAERVRYQPPSRMVYVVAALCLVALGLASFTVTYLALPPKQNTQSDPVAPQPKTSPVEKFPQNAPPPKGQQPAVTQPGPGDERAVDTTPRWAKKISGIKVPNAPMLDAFKLIEAQTGMKIIVAPGTPNPAISLDYQDMTAMEILAEIGKDQGFTPMDQGDGSVIIVPAVEPESGGGANPKGVRPTTGAHKGLD